jgi:hypothetical protein
MHCQECMKYNIYHNYHNSKTSILRTLATSLPHWIRRVLCLALLLSGITSLTAQDLTLAWDANPESDIAGYRLHYGTTPGNYTQVKDVGNTTTASVGDLVAGTTYYFVVSAYNTADLEGPASEEVSTTYRPVAPDADHDGLPDAWETQHGIAQLDNATLGGAAGDPDGDGLSNLAEYALNLDPTSPQQSSPTASAIQVNPVDGKSYLTLTYKRRVNVPEIVFGLEASNDLKNWSTDAAHFEQVGSPILGYDGTTETVSIRVKPAIGESSESANLVRLRVKQTL